MEADDLTACALMTTLILSMNWFRVRKVGLHQRVTEPHVKFTRDRNSALFGIPYNSSEFEVQMLEEASCVAPNSRTKTATSFPSIRCGRHIFTDKLVWKLVDDILNTWSDRLLLCFPFISNWVTNFSVGFYCVMFLSTVVVLDVFSAWVTLKHHASIWTLEYVFCCKFHLLQYCQIFLRLVNNKQSNRKNKKVPVFWNT